RLQAVGGSYTVEEWNALLAQYDRCPGCLRKWDQIPPLPSDGVVVTVDQVIPITKGGPNTIDNVQPLCYSGNSRKGDRASDYLAHAPYHQLRHPVGPSNSQE